MTVSATTPATGTRPPWATMLLAGAAMVVFLDILRVLLPSIAFIYGRAGSTPAAEMGLFAFLLFATAGLLARTAGINTNVAMPISLVGTVAARTALVLVDGGTGQLLASSLGLVAVVALFGALAASDLPIREATRGLALGLLVSLTVHTMLGTHDSLWTRGGLGWLVTATAVGALVYGWAQARPTTATPSVRTTVPWLLIGPVISFQGIAAGTPGPIRSGFGGGAVGPAVALVVASAAGYVAARFITSSPLRSLSGTFVLVPSALTAVLLIGAGDPGIAAAASLMATFVATLGLTISGESIDDPLASRGRRSAAPAAGMVFTFLIVFGYYASYELKIGFPRGLLPAAATMLLGLVLYQLKTNDKPDAQPTRDDLATIAFAPFLVLFVVMAGQVRLAPPPFDASLSEVRVMTWNVHMGYDDQGRFNPNEIVDIVAQQQPDVLVLNEVDRGWLLSGGHDLLTILADELQLEYTFGAAADAIWGNAILSRHPIVDPVVSLLPGDAPMDRGFITAKIDVGGQPLGIIATHFHHLHDNPEDDAIRRLQAETIAESATALEQRAIPVIILGDLNATPGSEALEPLERYQDLVASASSGAFLPTFPAAAPVEQIDHILASRGIRATRLDIPRTTASDHLPIAVTIDAG